MGFQDTRTAAVFFDLDGTLLDTAPDLATTLNDLRRQYDLPPLPLATVRPHVSHGATALVKLGFQLEPGNPEFASRREELLEIYEQYLTRETKLFPGIEAVLENLAHRGIPWGVITNKPARYTEPLLAHLGLSARAACILSGDSIPQKKPDPEPIRHAARHIGCDPRHTIMIGDAQRDIAAGKAAGARTLAALFGYIGPQDKPQDWGADGMVSQPLEILAFVSSP